MKNATEETKKRIKEMIDQKEADLAQIRQMQTEAQTQKEAADMAIKAATAEMNLDAYEEAKQAKRKAQAALDMYAGKLKQIQQQEYVTEEESDRVINSMLVYEDALAKEFKEKLQGLISDLAGLHHKYVEAIYDTEKTIQLWEKNIHANFRSQTATYADGTNRSPLPVPVHVIPFIGCKEAQIIGNFLEKIEGV